MESLLKKESNSDLPVYWFIFDDKGRQIIEYSMMLKKVMMEMYFSLIEI